MKNNKKRAHKRCTLLYASELKKENGMSAAAVKKAVEMEYGKDSCPSERTIQRYVKEGRAGLSPKKNGPPGDILHGTFLMLANAFKSFFRISQLNGTIKDSCRFI